ncbi:MAG: GNAT family N-acetyltransferase [Lentisphaeria bacterium]|nr:GNAT family N-acetyltransferase [Candidatus Neomarinimicrobiota bacterium]MCF7843173.1 GNAT family N-acetyltransferase [Lentisphaeria bacterium]
MSGTEILIQPEPVTLERVTELDVLIFGDTIVTADKMEQIQAVPNLLLVASHEKRPVGFKLAYAGSRPSHFHSWLGGVVPQYRRRGIAFRMLQMQEEWARSAGFTTIGFNTFHRFPEMQALGRKAGYALVKSTVEKGEAKLWFEKRLS